MLLQVGRNKESLSDHTHKQILDAVKELFKTHIVIRWGIHHAICLQDLPKMRIILIMIGLQQAF